MTDLTTLTDDHLVAVYLERKRQFQAAYRFERDRRFDEVRECWAVIVERGLQERVAAALTEAGR